MVEKNESLRRKIIEDIVNSGEDFNTYDIIIEVLKYYSTLVPFKEPDPDNLLEEAEEDVYPCDTRFFGQYIGGIENGMAPLVNQYEGDDIAIKFNYRNKDCIMGVTYQEYTPYEEMFSNCFTSTIIVPIPSDKRLHIGVREDYLKRKIVNYNDKLDEYDSKYGEEYQGYFSDNFSKIKDVENFSKPTVKYNFSEIDELWLQELLDEYKVEASIVMFHGYLVIDALVNMKDNFELNIRRIIDFIEFVNQVINKFENV